ncbi:biotin-dependent carboxylase-like uncharacterized protein [Arenicella xantha]|uniref:Biotin-dependent carboxylase-like uncharacterized protein n=2 Tax=Arenicella xantha TaxID=644221 RepID=A0A395JN43_9GAMM|nr:biotin-dependent carboxylase-like uncharacterized protein [Arenicella xantha]
MQNGVTEAGAADIQAFCWANKLLDKAVGSAMFEITLGNLELEFLADCQVAITGADLSATIDGAPVLPWRTYTINAGGRLLFGFPKSGLRAYLAVNAELDLPSHYQSHSSVAHENLVGALNYVVGKVFNAEQINQATMARGVARRFIPDYQQPLTVEVMLGYQSEDFSQQALEQLFFADYTIRPDSNRMAYRLEGPTISHTIQQLYSEGIAYGAIQIPPDGQPVVLLNDRQTMGGYPKVGCITRLSGSSLAQRMPGTSVKFEPVTIKQSGLQWTRFLRFFDGPE